MRRVIARMSDQGRPRDRSCRWPSGWSARRSTAVTSAGASRRDARPCPRSRRSRVSKRNGGRGGKPTAPIASTARPRDEIYAIDTPPPTVSGSLHVGHVFSFTHTDVIARFQRMRGRRPSSIRWGGTTTGCRPSAAFRTISGCAAIRRCRTTRRSRRRRRRRRSRRSRCRVRTSSNSAPG